MVWLMMKKEMIWCQYNRPLPHDYIIAGDDGDDESNDDDDDDDSDDANITATCLPPSPVFLPWVRRWQTDEPQTAL